MVKKKDDNLRHPPPFNPYEKDPDATAVDLGDDLLVTTQIEKDQLAISPTVESAEDQLATAKILMNEGLLEDAKKVLRRILIHDPDHQPARFTLKDILDREMKDLLSEKETITHRPRVFERKGKEARGPEPTTDEVVHSLEEALGSHQDQSSEKNFPIVAQQSIKDLTANDRVDLGIAFIEMGAYDKAIEIFRSALHFIDSSTPEGLKKNISTNVLLARAFLDSGRTFEAIQILHPLLRTEELSTEDKVEFFYLMGIAHERRGDRKAALAWYTKVRDIDPHFRDIRERLRKPLR